METLIYKICVVRLSSLPQEMVNHYEYWLIKNLELITKIVYKLRCTNGYPTMNIFFR